ncbi:MFS transporter [Streptomyces daliensis]|uniref:MFS transporter n=1 Tax=Streptomyces daliensis TaxID=299421 RepID=A0A8T4IYP3_9ACTN|nr:MFS transporter [Streptomyces daliensis]
MTQTASTPHAARPAQTSKSDGTDNRPRWILITLLTGQFMALLDVFIVNVAAPTLRAELHTTGAGLQLIVTGYTISYAVLLITGARLGAGFGHGRVFLIGLALFTATSLACGLAADAGQLTVFRFLQGAASAVMMPQVLSLIQRTFTGPARARALGAFSGVLAVGAASGQILGGVLVSADLFGTGWRPAFLVNVPIGVALLVLGARVLPREEHAARGAGRARDAGWARGLDLAGLLLLAAAVCLFTVPLVLGQEHGWPLWCFVSLALSAVLLGVFALHETRLARRGGVPLISPRVLRAPRMPLAVLCVGLVMALNSGFLFALSLHLQAGLGHSALRTGLVFVPTALAFGAVGLTWQRLPARALRAAVPGGLLLAGAAFVAIGALLRGGGDGGPWLLVAFVALGAGLGLGYNPALTGGLASVRKPDAAEASGLLTTTSQLGMLTGVATFGTLFLDRLEAGGSSAPALWTTALVLAVTAVAGAFAGVLGRDRRPGLL